MIKLGILSEPTLFDELRPRIACFTSESEIKGTFKKSEKVKRALFGITTEEGELKPKKNNPQRLQQDTLAVLLHFRKFLAG
jgi:hypothetical protein